MEERQTRVGTSPAELRPHLRLVLYAFFCRPTGMSNPCSRSWLAQFPIVPIDLPYFSASALNDPGAARSARNCPPLGRSPRRPGASSAGGAAGAGVATLAARRPVAFADRP